MDSEIIIEGNKLFEEFKGALTENYILQALVKKGYTPRYFAFEGTYEIDFMLQLKNKIIPIEVKAGENVKSLSLNRYAKKYEPEMKLRFSLKNLEKDENLINIPLFLIDMFEKFL